MAARLSIKQGWLTEQDYTRIENLIKQAKLPTNAPENMSADAAIRYMSVDKKVRDGKLFLVLLHKIGVAVLTADFKPTAFEATLQECCNS